ncbi:putative Androgen-induced 1 [Hypsibius exemplaris]|uniref:Androgen-induced 1 n=1 Tax=Hypsibius exemplaris TaxID=2072580 RepID=A0A1W0WC48_HYPEX|nr:putative Androgen-induced 1 [Hypsibius exemplaris]
MFNRFPNFSSSTPGSPLPFFPTTIPFPNTRLSFQIHLIGPSRGSELPSPSKLHLANFISIRNVYSRMSAGATVVIAGTEKSTVTVTICERKVLHTRANFDVVLTECRKMSGSTLTRFAFHAGATAMYWGTIWYDFHHIDLGPAIGWDAYGGKLRFLTFIDLCIQALFYALCTGYDLSVLFRVNPKQRLVLKNAKDHMFTVMVFPIGAFVVLMFWAIYAVDRELIFPQFLDDVFPAWANHVMHTVILPVNLIEMALDYHAHPKSRWSGLKNLVIFSFAYQVWVLWVYYKTSSWVYPIFNALNGWQKVAFLQGATVGIIVLYFVGELLQQKVFNAKKGVKEAQPASPRRAPPKGIPKKHA